MQKMLLNFLFNFVLNLLKIYTVEPPFKIGLGYKVFIP
jgi:hypothetical protein